MKRTFRIESITQRGTEYESRATCDEAPTEGEEFPIRAVVMELSSDAAKHRHTGELFDIEFSRHTKPATLTGDSSIGDVLADEYGGAACRFLVAAGIEPDLNTAATNLIESIRKAKA